MCYSADIVQAWEVYVEQYESRLTLAEFAEIFYGIIRNSKIKIPKAMLLAFSRPRNDEEREIKKLIDEYNLVQATELEQTLFAQRKRLADAERALQTKVTKAATESKRIATNKIEWAKGKLADLRRTELKPRDSRIYPGYYAPVMVWEDGKRVIKPMRYQCRPAGKPAIYDTKYPGTYNARRDNLDGFWKEQFGYTHGVVLMRAFYEHVKLKQPGSSDAEDVVLEFRPQTSQLMLVACLWSRWTSPGEPDLLSFAAITDEPPEEIAAAGHDRCVIPIRLENLDAWLNPDPANKAALQAILDDRERPYYEHRMAA